MAAVNDLARVCAALRVPRSTVYRIDAHWRRLTVAPVVRSSQPAPPTIYATLLDEGTYLGSVRTLYRLLAAGGRTTQSTHPSRLRQTRTAGHRSQ